MNRKGFTLIELLIVVAIIGIIAAIAIPTLLSTRGAAATNKAKATLRQISTAQAAYYAKYNTYNDFDALADTTLPEGAYLDARFSTAGGYNEGGIDIPEINTGVTVPIVPPEVPLEAFAYEAVVTMGGNTIWTGWVDESGYIREGAMP
jgi:prepilin-type N-terminal cleavage/methylation domain-containing protein